MSHRPKSASLSRRQFIRGAGSLLAATAAFGVVGCDDSTHDDFLSNNPGAGAPPPPGGTPPPVSVPTGNLQGRVLLDEVGGEGLTIVSNYADNAPLDATGAFDTVVSTEAAQLLLLQDVNGSVRAMGISVPANVNASRDVRGQLDLLLQIGAESTALTLVFVTRGILTVNPIELITTYIAIRGLNSFSAFSTLVRSRMTFEGLENTAGTEEFQSLLLDVIKEYADLYQIRARAIRPTLPDQLGTGNVGLSYGDEDPTPLSNLTFTNASWRYVSLYQEDLAANGNLVPPRKVPVIEGVANPTSERNILPAANGDSWGGFITHQNELPSTGFERLALDDRPQVRRLHYYVYGPGFPADFTFPEEVESQLTSTPFGLTFVYFGLLPILDLVAGTAKGLSKGAEIALEVFSNVVGQGVNADGLKQSYASGDPGNIAAAAGDFCVGIVSLGASAIVAFGTSAGLVLSAKVVAFLGAGSSLVFSGRNFYLAVDATLYNPSRAGVYINAPGEAPAADLVKLALPTDTPIRINSRGDAAYVAIAPDDSLSLRRHQNDGFEIDLFDELGVYPAGIDAAGRVVSENGDSPAVYSLNATYPLQLPNDVNFLSYYEVLDNGLVVAKGHIFPNRRDVIVFDLEDGSVVERFEVPDLAEVSMNSRGDFVLYTYNRTDGINTIITVRSQGEEVKRLDSARVNYGSNLTDIGTFIYYRLTQGRYEQVPLAVVGSYTVEGRSMEGDLRPLEGYESTQVTQINSRGEALGYSLGYDGYDNPVQIPTLWRDRQPIALRELVATAAQNDKLYDPVLGSSGHITFRVRADDSGDSFRSEGWIYTPEDVTAP